MKSINHLNDDNILIKSDYDLFNEVVGNSIQDLKKKLLLKDSNFINDVFSNKKFISDTELNIMGLHIYRILLSHRVWKFKEPCTDIAKEYFDTGAVLINNFLPTDYFDSLKEFCNTTIEQNFPDGGRPKINARELFLENPKFIEIVKSCANVDSLRANDNFGGYPNTELLYFKHLPGDDSSKSWEKEKQYKFHTDTFQPCFKCWLYLDDVGMDEGPFNFVVGSNKINFRRLSWDYESSLISTEKYSYLKKERDSDGSGSFRINEIASYVDEKNQINDLGYREIKSYPSKSNSLLIANPFGFHKRGVGKTGVFRKTIHSQYRRLPFNIY